MYFCHDQPCHEIKCIAVGLEVNITLLSISISTILRDGPEQPAIVCDAYDADAAVRRRCSQSDDLIAAVIYDKARTTLNQYRLFRFGEWRLRTNVTIGPDKGP